MADVNLVIDCETGEAVEVELTAAEQRQRDIDQAEAAKEAAMPKPATAEERLAAIEQAITKASDFAAMKADLAASDASAVDVQAVEAKSAAKPGK